MTTIREIIDGLTKIADEMPEGAETEIVIGMMTEHGMVQAESAAVEQVTSSTMEPDDPPPWLLWILNAPRVNWTAGVQAWIRAHAGHHRHVIGAWMECSCGEEIGVRGTVTDEMRDVDLMSSCMYCGKPGVTGIAFPDDD